MNTLCAKCPHTEEEHNVGEYHNCSKCRCTEFIKKEYDRDFDITFETD